jgi:hypothetical protein
MPVLKTKIQGLNVFSITEPKEQPILLQAALNVPEIMCESL